MYIWGRVGNRGSGRVNVSPGRVGSGPRKVTRGQLCDNDDDDDNDVDDGQISRCLRCLCDRIVSVYIWAYTIYMNVKC